MSEVKIYDFVGCDKKLVAIDDYAALQQKLDALAAENAALKGFFETGINASFEGCDFFGDHMQSRALELGLIREEIYCKDQHENMVVDPSDLDDGDTVYFINETPATAAYLNSVRADEVNHAGKMIFATMNHQDKGVERALECLAEVELQYTLAAQLRAGEDK